MAVSSAPTQLSDYLEKLPGTTFRKLYQQPSSALAVFRRMLPNLAKIFVMRMLYLPKPLLLTSVDAWVKPESRRLRDQCLSILKGLHMVQISPPSRDKPQEIQLTSNFKKSMRMALEGTGNHDSFGVMSSLPVPPEVDLAFLDRYAGKKSDDILHYIVNSVAKVSSADSGGPKASVKDLLLGGGLIDRRPGVAGVSITQRGFTFLLQENNTQVWTLLLLWLEAGEATAGVDSVDMLSFLFMLATMQLGKAYDTNALTEQRQNMLPALVDFGLIYIPSHKPQQYFPTRLATTLTSGTSNVRSAGESLATATATAMTRPSAGLPGSSSEHKGGIILETNFRLYVYTSSPLQIAVLNLFAKLSIRFADMVAGRLSRKSMKRAIVHHGITADQIINYLATHAHEQMHRMALAQGKPLLPPTVVDQIRLWQLENERMKATTGFLFRDFDDQQEYDAVVSFADQIGVLVWRHDKKGMFFASKHEQIRDYLKLRKKGE